MPKTPTRSVPPRSLSTSPTSVSQSNPVKLQGNGDTFTQPSLNLVDNITPQLNQAEQSSPPYAVSPSCSTLNRTNEKHSSIAVTSTHEDTFDLGSELGTNSVINNRETLPIEMMQESITPCTAVRTATVTTQNPAAQLNFFTYRAQLTFGLTACKEVNVANLLYEWFEATSAHLSNFSLLPYASENSQQINSTTQMANADESMFK